VISHITQPAPIWYHPGMRATLTTAACLIALTCLAGCGGSSSSVDNRSTTVGQELKDLEEARNKGLLTEDDYQKQREAILDRK
jgi:hypothetical protein